MRITESYRKEVNMKRTATTVILLICIILILAFCFTMLNLFHMGKFRLSMMSNWLCKQFLFNNGISIPEEFADLDFRLQISFFEAFPEAIGANGSPAYDALMVNIRDAVNAYYGIS